MAIRKQVLQVKDLTTKGRGGVSEWIQPVMSPKWYTLFCCDCALGHQFQFRIYDNKVQFRVRRADLYTQMRRKHKAEKDHISILKKGECVRALVNNVMVITLVNGLRRGGKVERKKRKRHG